MFRLRIQKINLCLPPITWKSGPGIIWSRGLIIHIGMAEGINGYMGGMFCSVLKK